MRYIPLRVYSVFSRGHGAVRPEDLVRLMKKSNGPIAVTDPFSTMAWESFHRAAGKNGVKFLPGTEISLRGAGSVVLFPLSIDGYFSMISSFNTKKLSMMKDVTAIFISSGRGAGITSIVKNLKGRIPEGNFYMGLEWNSRRQVVEASSKFGIPIVWSQPLKWIGTPERYEVANSVFNHLPAEEAGNCTDIPLYGPLSYSAVLKRWGNTGKEALKNTFSIAEAINFDFGESFGSHPDKLLKGTPGKGDPLRQLKERVENEIKKRGVGEEGKKRAAKELASVKKLGFAPYFLIASEIISYCRKEKIYFNIRGSGGSSYILYLLGLSRVDPLGFKLLFERFVNSLRDELPDIDIDIDSSRRGEVLKWVFERFSGRVAFISTHKFFRGRSALYEVARSYGFDPEESHRMSKNIPIFASPSELKGKGTGQLRKVHNRASLLDGIYRELSLHLGGVIFSDRPVRDSFPVEVSPHGFDQVVWDKDTVERLKVFKLDLLGVRGFDVISPYVYSEKIDFEDPGVWSKIRSAETKGCFQLESPLARENLEKAKPETLEELAISIAIIRPGPAKSGMKRSYLENITPLHPLLREIFPYTRGAVIFEEQISMLIHHVTGWNLELSERVRRKLKKRRGEEYRDKFFLSGRKKGWNNGDLGKFWKLASDFSLYAFNHAHSISYAYSAYASAWMKSKFPVKFFARLFNSGGGYYPLPVYIEEAKRNGVKLLPPDINISDVGFTEEGDAIRTGLIFVKGIGSKLSSVILKERRIGYVSLEDFALRTRAGERELSALMAVSAFNSIGCNGFSPEEREKNWDTYLGFIPVINSGFPV